MEVGRKNILFVGKIKQIKGEKRNISQYSTKKGKILQGGSQSKEKRIK